MQLTTRPLPLEYTTTSEATSLVHPQVNKTSLGEKTSHCAERVFSRDCCTIIAATSAALAVASCFTLAIIVLVKEGPSSHSHLAIAAFALFIFASICTCCIGCKSGKITSRDVETGRTGAGATFSGAGATF